MLTLSEHRDRKEQDRHHLVQLRERWAQTPDKAVGMIEEAETHTHTRYLAQPSCSSQRNQHVQRPRGCREGPLGSRWELCDHG